MTSEQLSERIGKALRRRRVNLELSQGTLTSRTGIAKEHISRFENGHASPSAANLMTLAEALETTVAALLGLE